MKFDTQAESNSSCHIYICAYMCMCVCVGVRVCAHTCEWAYIYTHTHTCMGAHSHTHTCIHVCAYMQLIVAQLRLKLDLVLYPARAEGLGKYGYYIALCKLFVLRTFSYCNLQKFINYLKLFDYVNYYSDNRRGLEYADWILCRKIRHLN